MVRNEDAIRLSGIDESEFKAICNSELAEIERQRQRYLGDRPRIDVTGRVAIIIDDGIATGTTTRAALRVTRMRKPGKLVLAVSVAPTNTLAAMREEADHVVCLEDYEFFGAIGFYYSDFSQTADQEVIDAIAHFPAPSENEAAKPTAEKARPFTIGAWSSEGISKACDAFRPVEGKSLVQASESLDSIIPGHPSKDASNW